MLLANTVFMKKLLIATSNPGKITEYLDLLKKYSFKVLTLRDFAPIPDPIEDGETFIENATLKAKYYYEKTGVSCLADDSGLCVKALEGAPGIHSARWAGPDRDFRMAVKRIEKELKEKSADDLTAYFTSTVAYYDGENVKIGEGRLEGHLTLPAKAGTKGFVYDGVFMPRGESRTLGEMREDEKTFFSYRKQALEQVFG